MIRRVPHADVTAELLDRRIQLVLTFSEEEGREFCDISAQGWRILEKSTKRLLLRRILSTYSNEAFDMLYCARETV